MQVQRRIKDMKGRQLTIELPESFVNHKVEIIVLTVDDLARVDVGDDADVAQARQRQVCGGHGRWPSRSL